MTHDTDERPIPGHPGYIATAGGQIVSCYRGRRILKARPNRDGYLQLGLYRPDGGRTKHAVHHFVLLAFAGTPVPPRHHGRHLNGDQLDNRASNLAWGTQAENYADQVRHGSPAIPPAMGLQGEAHPSARLNERQVRDIEARARAGESMRAIGREYGIHGIHVAAIRDHKNWRHLWESA